MTGGALVDFVRGGGMFVLSGAGLSTESGIPDYRLPDGTRRAIPMTFQEFSRSDEAKKRYWSRSAVGWLRFHAAAPNAGHRAVTALQEAGLISTLVTQNVDGLHQQAGSTSVIDLHGNLDRVVCLTCEARWPRAGYQQTLATLNPHLPAPSEVLADGDALVSPAFENTFRLAPCPSCGSTSVKPDVVMFGESVPAPRVQECFEGVRQARAMLVLGSSLKVMSGYRFVREASRLGQPIAMVGLGQMRGEEKAQLVIREPLGECLTQLVLGLGAQTTEPTGVARKVNLTR